MSVFNSHLNQWFDVMPWSLVLLLMTAAAFLVYGLQIFVSRYMRSEYVRFGMNSRQRNLIGIIQVLGSLALLLGIAKPTLGLIASFGFVFMMFIALRVRWKLKDSIIESTPALLLLLANLWLCRSYLFWFSS